MTKVLADIAASIGLASLCVEALHRPALLPLVAAAVAYGVYVFFTRGWRY